MKIAFIGGGAMGEAILSAILDNKLALPSEITVSDLADTRRQHLESQYGVAVTSDNRLAIEGADVVVLAVKPQNLEGVIAELSGQLKKDQLVLSIIAGARIDTLSHGLKHGPIVRAMPNTPARIGEGMTVWTVAEAVNSQQRQWTASILRAMGREIFVEDEKYIDMATAISGSGPAYVFLMIESLVEAALHIGLPRNIAEELVLQTAIGAAHFALKSDKSPAELREMVTSPGGTTATALQKLSEGNFGELLKQAVTAAFNRARELGS
ncbi:MAG TPA: pyrroline-5-carboxylate reductase [Dehalococcoidia bacterium]|nr:pyrroline-5-carboxylate reductase [Dehalococcoidia bacterium]